MLLSHVGGLSRARIVLASGSPRRRELLGSLGLKFEVRGAKALACAAQRAVRPPMHMDAARSSCPLRPRRLLPHLPRNGCATICVCPSQVCVSTFEETLPHSDFAKASDYAVTTGTRAVVCVCVCLCCSA